MINLLKVPFSRFGSYFVISLYNNKASNDLYIRDIRGGDNDPGLLFLMKFYKDNEEVKDYTIECTETLLKVYKGEDEINFIYPDEGTLRINGKGLTLKLFYQLMKYDNIYKIQEDSLELCSYSKEIKLLLQKINGNITVDAPWEQIGNTHINLSICQTNKDNFDFIIESYKVVSKLKEDTHSLSFDEAHVSIKDEYDAWLRKLPMVPKKYEARKGLASYITWMNFVKPEGILKRYAMYMSKNWMTNIWSWDNCFGAIYLSKHSPELAYDQYIFFKDHQDDSGIYPDFANNDYISFSCVKPPIYGWCYDYLMKRNAFFSNPERLNEVYETVSKQTEFWLKYRKSSIGLPYYAHGNDSGWDNSTVFDKGIPVVSPDLTAYLIYQIDFLSRLSALLGKNDENKWDTLSENLTNLLIEKLWKEDSFKSYLLSENKWIEEGDSLQLLLPIVISYRLPDHINKTLIDSLSDSKRFYADYGLATEALNSKFYKKNGYWRGPVWAPVMLIFIDSINKSGYTQLARDLAKRFCDGVLIGGMAENFDPMSGEGLVDPAFAWTSSVFITLIEDYLS